MSVTQAGSTLNVVSSDEKTSIQALCHLHTEKAKPGKIKIGVPKVSGYGIFISLILLFTATFLLGIIVGNIVKRRYKF